MGHDICVYMWHQAQVGSFRSRFTCKLPSTTSPPLPPFPPSAIHPSIRPLPAALSINSQPASVTRPPKRDPSFSPPQRLLIHPHALFTPPARPLTQTSRNARPFAFRNDFNVITHFANSLKPRFPPLPSFLLGISHSLSLPSPSCLPSSSVQDTSLRFSTPLSLLLRLTQPLRRRQSAFLPFPPTPWPARPSIRRALHAYASAFASSSSPPGPPQHKHPHAGRSPNKTKPRILRPPPPQARKEYQVCRKTRRGLRKRRTQK